MVRTITRRSAIHSSSSQQDTPSKSYQTKDFVSEHSEVSHENVPTPYNESAEEKYKESSFNQREDMFDRKSDENVTQENVNNRADDTTRWDKTEGEPEGKGKFKSKNNTDLENSSLLNENEQQTNSDISETVQVTAQSPSITNAVDNENSDASNCVQSVNCYVDNSHEDGISTSDNNTDNIQSGEVVESEQTSDNIDKAKTVSSSDVKVNRSVSTDYPQAKEGKKIRLRRNTVHGTEQSKSMHSTQRTSQENGKNESESETAEEERRGSKKASVKIKLNRDGYRLGATNEQESHKDSTSEIDAAKKDSTSTESKPKHKQWTGVVQIKPISKIDVDILKQLCNKIDVLDEKDVKLDLPIERVKATSESEKKMERKVSIEYNEGSERPDFKKQESTNSSGDEAKEDNKNIIAFNRKISIVDDTASKLRPPPEPAKNPISEVLFITNLVRPFTIKQLKELLERTGKIRLDGFWTDRIKSKCYVRYYTKEEAETTRNALHGVNWPIGNGKQLMIEYATVEDMERTQNPPSMTPPRADLPKDKILPEKENKDPVKKRRISDEAPKEPSRDKTKRKPEARVREWDIGKEDLHRRRSRSRSRDRVKSRERDRSRGRERSRERNHRSKERDRSHKHKRSLSPVGGYAPKKQKKVEEEVPQKLMDDLFLKTKATPSIYWQPLSPEEIATKQQQRLVRMEEHKRRMEVTGRTRGGRDSGRGAAYRRR